MRVFSPIGFIASVHNSFKSKTLIEVYANNVGISYFHLSPSGLKIFSVYPVPLERSYVSDVTVEFLGFQVGKFEYSDEAVVVISLKGKKSRFPA
jgi:hypothetical protein